MAVFAVVFCFFIFKPSNALTSETTIKSGSTNYESEEQGAWKITQKATASSSSTAELKIKVESILKGNGHDKDVFVMMDTSGSMTNERITKTRDAVVSLASTLLADGNGDNRIAMAAFNTDVSDVVDWQNDTMLFRLYVHERLPSATGGTDYYKAIRRIDEQFENYEHSENRDAIVLFITDGAPVEDHPLEEAEFLVLKEKYPWLTVQGIQFEMGDEIIDEIKMVSDNQFASNLENVEDVVFEAALDGYKYNEFDFNTIINDEYYEVASIDATAGEASIENSHITWNMSDVYRSGTKQTLTVELNVKQACIDKDDSICPVETRTSIDTKLPDTPNESQSTTESPVLQFRFDVSYDLNAPTGCDEAANTLPETVKQLIYTPAQISDCKPTCEGYQFRGWAIVSDYARRYNEDWFDMPEEDVILRAIWGAPSIAKTMDGTIAPTTYATFKKARPNTGWPAASRNGYDSLYVNIADGDRANIEHIVFSTDTPPIDAILDDTRNFADPSSELPIYGYYVAETKTFYFYSDADVVYLNEDSRGLFAELKNLVSIEGASHFNTDKVKSLDYLFYRTSNLTTVEGLSSWTTPVLESLVEAFNGTTSLSSADGLEGWDVSHVTNFGGLFVNSGVSDLSALASWHTDSATTLESAFRGCRQLANLHGVEDWDVSHVTNLNYAFEGTYALSNLEALSDWDTSNVTTMVATFQHSIYNNNALVSLHGLERWNTGNVTNMSYLFAESKALQDIEALSEWDVRNVTTLASAFLATKITSADAFTKWKTNSLTNMDSIFMDTSLSNIDGLSGWDTSHVTTMRRVFARVGNLTSLTALDEWQTPELTSLAQAFWGTSVTTTNGLQDWDVRKVTTMAGMFQATPKLADLSYMYEWKTNSLTDINNMFSYDYHNSSIVTLHGLEKWDVSKVTNMNGFCYGCMKLTTVQALDLWRPVALKSAASAFEGTTVLASLNGLQDWRTPQLTTLEATFKASRAITNVSQLAGWTVSNVTNMNDIFYGATNLSDISALSNWTTTSLQGLYSAFSTTSVADISPLSGWNTDNLTTIGGIFNTTKITNLNALAGWNPSKITNMYNSFAGNPTLTDVSALGNWTNTNALTTISNIFAGDSGLTSVSGLANFNVSKVSNASGAFNNCTHLSDISALSGWSTGNMRNLSSMFRNNYALTSVEALGGWNVESATDLTTTFEGVAGVEDFSPLNAWQLPDGASKNNTFRNTSSTATLPSWY